MRTEKGTERKKVIKINHSFPSLAERLRSAGISVKTDEEKYSHLLIIPTEEELLEKLRQRKPNYGETRYVCLTHGVLEVVAPNLLRKSDNVLFAAEKDILYPFIGNGGLKDAATIKDRYMEYANKYKNDLL